MTGIPTALRNCLLIAALVATAGAAGYYFALSLNYPHAAIGVSIGGVATIGAITLRTAGLRTAALSLTSIFLILSLLESGLYFWTNSQVKSQRDYDPNYRTGPLGYHLNPSTTVTDRKYYPDGTPIYEVSYSIGPDGLRVVPGTNTRSGAPHVLFFGGSFVMGEGLNDDQTIPYYFSEALGGQYHVLNFGAPGYGTHQMLRSLELDLPKQSITGPTPYAIYLFFPGHIHRVTGQINWGHDGPMYELTGTGEPKYVGAFNRSSKILNSIYTRFLTYDFAIRPFTVSNDQKINLTLSIVQKSRDLLRDKYDAQLIVLLWDNNSEISNELHSRLLQTDLEFVLKSTATKDKDWKKYIIAGDGHPSAAATEPIGKMLARHVENKKAPQ